MIDKSFDQGAIAICGCILIKRWGGWVGQKGGLERWPMTWVRLLTVELETVALHFLSKHSLLVDIGGRPAKRPKKTQSADEVGQ